MLILVEILFIGISILGEIIEILKFLANNQFINSLKTTYP